MELVSERLVLRPADTGDLDVYVGLRNHPEILAASASAPRSRSEVARQLQAKVEQWGTQGFGTWTVLDRATGEPLGRVELEPIGTGWEGIDADEVEVGCIVDPDHWNRGIATEATELAVADFFARIDGRRLVALSASDNGASLRVLEKLPTRSRGATHVEGDETIYLCFEFERPERPLSPYEMNSSSDPSGSRK